MEILKKKSEKIKFNEDKEVSDHTDITFNTRKMKEAELVKARLEAAVSKKFQFSSFIHLFFPTASVCVQWTRHVTCCDTS